MPALKAQPSREYISDVPKDNRIQAHTAPRMVTILGL